MDAREATMETSTRKRVGWWRRLARDTQAGPIVEFAIIVPVLLILLLGIVDFGLAFFQQNLLVAAAREGARLAAVQQKPCDGATQTIVRDRVRLLFVGTRITPPANNATAIPITFVPNTCGTSPNSVQSITVRIANFPYTPLTPVFRLVNLSGTINMTATAVYRWERSP